MIDTRQINLLELIGRDTQLKKVASTGGGEFHASCPFCGGEDRFAVQPNGHGWSCRQCTPHWQDAIAYVQRRDGVGFKQAVETLGLPLDQQPRSKLVHRPLTPDKPQALDTDYIALSDESWQREALHFCEWAYKQLWLDSGHKALEYLLERGITQEIIDQAGLGYNATDTHVHWGTLEVFLPRGIVIPWFIGDKIWKVNVRRPIGDPKYLQVAGGANGLYNADAIRHDDYVFMTEGEFDSLVLRSHCQGIKAVATGTTSGARLLRWTGLLSMAYQVIVAYDADELTNDGVKKAVQWWLNNLGDKAIRLMPTEHDITDMYKAGHDLQAWLGNHTFAYSFEPTPEMIARRQVFRDELLTGLGWKRAA